VEVERAPVVSLKAVLNFKAASKLFSAKTLTGKASLNALAAGVEYAARLVVGFLVTPFLVASLGDYSYGIWQVLGRLIDYLTPASGRPTQALKWTIAYRQTSADYEEKRRQVGSTLAVWLLFLPVLLLGGGLLAWFTPALLSVPEAFSPIVRIASVLLVVDLIMTNLTDVPRSVLEGENLGYKRMGLTAILQCVSAGLLVLAVYLKGGIVGLAAATLAGTVLTGVFFLQIVRVYVPWFGIAKPLLAEVRRFLGLSGWFLVWRLVMQLMTASDVVVLGTLASAELVTAYTLTKYVPETIINFVAITVFAVTPGLGGIIGAGDLQKAARVRGEIGMITWLLATVAGSTIVLWDQSFVQLWVGTQYFVGSTPTLLIVVGVLQFVMIRTDANIIDLTLRLGHKVLIGLFSAILSVVIAGVLVSVFQAGVVGVALGFLIGRSVLSFGYPWMIGRFLGISLSSQISSTLRPVGVTLLLYVLASLLSQVLAASSWPVLVIAVSLTLLVVGPLAFYVGLSRGQRSRLWQRIRGLRRSGASE
jgi:O-antigen/teichoic acid export membrane protein